MPLPHSVGATSVVIFVIGLTVVISIPFVLMKWACPSPNGAANGIGKDATGTYVFPSFSVCSKAHTPVSVLPDGSVPPAVQGEPSLPLQASVFLPSDAVNSEPPCLLHVALDFAISALVTLVPFAPAEPDGP